MKTTTPFTAGTAGLPAFEKGPSEGCAVLHDSVRDAVLARAAESSPTLTAVFAGPRHEVAYLNAIGLSWLDPRGDVEAGALNLEEIIGVDSLQRFQNEILPHVRVLGKWSGECELRDVWGSDFFAKVVFSSHTHPDGGLPLICLQAVKSAGSASNEIGFGDRELLHALLDSIPDCVYFKDLHSRMLRASRAMAAKMGVGAPSDLTGRTDFDFFSVEHAQRAYADERGIIRNQRPIINCEEKETWADGRVTWVSTTKVPLRNRHGEVVGTCGISRDITAAKESEHQQRELEGQLQLSQKLESVGRLAAGIAHEINTPTQFITDNAHFLVTAIASIRAVLKDYGALAQQCSQSAAFAPAIEAIRVSERAADLQYLMSEIPRTLEQSLDGLGRVARIVRSLKEFSHPNNANRSEANLNHAIENAITVSRHEWKYVARLVTEFETDPVLVPCVLDQFNQVMLNLIINAGQAIASKQQQPGAASDLGTITVRTMHDAQWAIVEVVDTGVGIPMGIRHRIFEPFFTTKDVGKGTGQGLNLVHAIVVKNHQGRIDFVSEEGHGTTFRVRLPLPPANKQEPYAT